MTPGLEGQVVAVTGAGSGLARFDQAMAGEVTVMDDAMAALRVDRDHVASTR